MCIAFKASSGKMYSDFICIDLFNYVLIIVKLSLWDLVTKKYFSNKNPPV